MFTHSPARLSLVRPSLALGVLALLALGTTVHAQTMYITTDTTLNTNLNSGVVVGYANQSDLSNQTNRASPTVNITGAASGFFLDAYNSSTVVMNSGNASGLSARDSATVNVRGGGISSGLHAYDNSVVNISGGNIAEGFSSDGSSTINLSGGTIFNELYVGGASTLNISGGNTQGTGNIYAIGSGTLRLFGASLSARLTNPNSNGYSQYAFSGALSDGSSVNGHFFYIQNDSNARVFINNFAVPEPGSVALLLGMGMSGAFVFARRTRRK